MSLSNFKIGPAMAVSDIDRAKAFYEDGLGLEVQEESPGEWAQYGCGEGTGLMIYLSPDHAGKSTATLAGWGVDDLDREMQILRDNGVEFAAYDQPDGIKTDENGVHSSDGGMRVCWIRDPDGNTFAINEGPTLP